MTDPHRLPNDIAAVDSRPGQMSRRRLLAAGLGAAVGLMAVERVVAALPNRQNHDCSWIAPSQGTGPG